MYPTHQDNGWQSREGRTTISSWGNPPEPTSASGNGADVPAASSTSASGATPGWGNAASGGWGSGSGWGTAAASSGWGASTEGRGSEWGNGGSGAEAESKAKESSKMASTDAGIANAVKDNSPAADHHPNDSRPKVRPMVKIPESTPQSSKLKTPQSAVAGSPTKARPMDPPPRPSSPRKERSMGSKYPDIKAALSEKLPRAVRLQIRYDQLTRELEQAKVLLASPQYGHVHDSARDGMEATRKSLEIELARVKRDLLAEIAFLAKLPENPKPSIHDYLPERDDEQLTIYTTQLRMWIEDVRKHLMHRIQHNAQARQQAAPKAPLESGELEESASPASSSSVAVEGADKQQSLLEQITSRLESLDMRMDEIAETSDAAIRRPFSLESITNDHIAADIEVDPHPLVSKTAKITPVANVLDAKMEAEVHRIADLLSREQAMTNELNELKALGAEVARKRQKLQADIALYNERMTSLGSQTRQIEEGLIRLENETPEPQTTTSDLTQLSPHLELAVRQILDHDIQPYLEQLYQDAEQQVQQLDTTIYSSTFERLKPALDVIQSLGASFLANPNPNT
ncbi:hypothetical protein HGRIS_013057 [Hohenbuehelia grisea]|uniref:Uncharacterized protein n=1 Tax=Hohenbuehelia grisea TaxID=104357 RepID=A0ABR3IUD9_9AGAR